MVREYGRPRDRVYFSIVAEEWPAVRQPLETMERTRERS